MTTARAIEEQIRETLSEHGELHVLELADRLEEHPLTVENACTRLHQNEDIVPTGRGVFSPNYRTG
ncbi:hypothetical protein [Natronobeatus ordinarius]|uniref:hypothetical protein n=1 Tax=Natronobeatus ordinarius TaxID=2963433 RepID=UPI0020CB71E6|nr:hypothetical protein [Natronobeatus ordinarius]